MNKLKSQRSLFFSILFLPIVLIPSLFAEPQPWPFEGSDLEPDGRVEYSILDNGIRTVFMPWDEPPGRISLRLVVEAGWLHETPEQRGFAHLLEHMAFNGTENYSADEMINYFQRLGMAFGADTNAHTWWRETVYKLEVPETNDEILNDSFLLLRDYATRMLLEDEEIDKERGVVLSELRDRNTPEYKAYKSQLPFTLPDTRIAKVAELDQPRVVEFGSADEVRNFYNTWYTPDRFVIIGVGDITQERFNELVKEHFADLEKPQSLLPTPDRGELESPVMKTKFHADSELKDVEIEIYNRSPDQREVETIESQKQNILEGIGNSILSKRLSILAKKEDSPIRTGQAYSYDWLDFVKITGIQVRSNPQEWEAALDVAVKELREAIEFGFDDVEFTEAKANVINAIKTAAETESTRKSRVLSSVLVRSIVDNSVFQDPRKFSEAFLPWLESIRIESVEDAFNQQWNTDDRLVFVAGNLDSKVSDIFNSALEKELEKREAITVAEFAYTEWGEPSLIMEKNYLEDLDTYQYVFENGVRLNIKHTDFDANRIHVGIRIGKGLFSASDQFPGLPFFAESTFIDGGLEAHSKDEIDRIFAGKTLGASFEIDANAFILRGLTSDEYFSDQLNLLAAYCLHSGFRAEAEGLFRKQLDALYQQTILNPRVIMQDRVEEFLSQNDFRFGIPEREDVKAVNSLMSRDWLKPILSSDYLEISVVGDFESQESIIEEVRKVFGALPTRNDFQPASALLKQVSLPEDGSDFVVEYPSTNPRSIVSLHWDSEGFTTIEHVRLMGVVGSILSDRLTKKVREEFGEAYSPYAYNQAVDHYDNYGYIRAVASVTPEQMDLIETIIIELAADLATNGASEDELIRAVEPIKNQIEERARSNKYWLNSVLLLSQQEPKRLEWARSYQDFFDSIELDAINDKASQFLDRESVIRVRIQPE